MTKLKLKKGFTYLEVLLATALFTFFFGLFSTFITESMASHRDSQNLSMAVNLAKTKMDQIKVFRETKSGEGDFTSNPKYSYKFNITEEEKNLLDDAKDMGLISDADVDTNSSSVSDFLKSRNKVSDSATFAIINLLKYRVEIYFNKNLEYALEFFRVPNI